MEEQTPQTETLQAVDTPTRPKWFLWLALGGLVILVCAAAFIAVLIYAGPQFIGKFMPESLKPGGQLTRAITQSNTMGDANAPIHIIEYGDFQCPYCLKFWRETEPQLIDEYVNTGKVYFEYRSMGEFLGEESQWSAEAVYCAGDQGRFWEYHDTLFSNWTGENVGDFTKEKLIGYAGSVGLDVQAFEKCLSEEKHKATVEQDTANAQADGVHATPTLIINGTKVEGAQPFDVLKHMIEELLDGEIDTVSG